MNAGVSTNDQGDAVVLTVVQGKPAPAKDETFHREIIVNGDDALSKTIAEELRGAGARIIGSLDAKPILIGHSFGGLLVQNLLGRGMAAAAVAIDPAPIKGVLALPVSSLRVASVLTDSQI